MNKTQNDLSANTVKLDYQSLVRTAKIAVGRSMNGIEEYQGKLHDDLGKGYGVGIKLHSDWLAREAERLALACNTLATLLGAETRGNVTVINLPEVPAEE